MATVSTSRRSAAGIALIVAGVLAALTLFLPLISETLNYVWPIANLALAVALVILAVGAVGDVVAKIAFIVGAVGWLLLAFAGLGIRLPIAASIAPIGDFLAALGTLIGAIVLLVGREISSRTAIVFVVAALSATVILLGRYAGIALGGLSTVPVIVFAAALIIAGFLFRQRGRRR